METNLSINKANLKKSVFCLKTNFQFVCYFGHGPICEILSVFVNGRVFVTAKSYERFN